MRAGRAPLRLMPVPLYSGLPAAAQLAAFQAAPRGYRKVPPAPAFSPPHKAQIFGRCTQRVLNPCTCRLPAYSAAHIHREQSYQIIGCIERASPHGLWLGC